MPAIKSLGIGSQVLTGDIIDKLKAADVKAQIDPIGKNITDNTTKQKDITTISTLLSSLKTSVSALGNETTYLKRKASVNGDSANVNVSSGVNLHDFNLDVKQLAQNDVYQTSKFGSENDIVSGGGKLFDNGDFTITLGSGSNKKEFKINIKQSDTYEDLANEINRATNGAVNAKILNVGEGKSQLIIQSKDSGLDNALSFSATKTKDTNGSEIDDPNSLKILSALGLGNEMVDKLDENSQPILDSSGNKVQITQLEANHIQKAQNAEFTYNGVNMSRQSNKFDDITAGVEITLKETGKTSVSINNDTENIISEIENLVKSYNELMNNLSASTDYNEQTGMGGVLQGMNEITTIKSSINKVLFEAVNTGRSVTEISQDKNGNEIKNIYNALNTVSDFGISLSEDGLLKFDKSKFNKMAEEDFDYVEKFFVGDMSHSKISYSSKDISGGAIYVSSGALKIGDKEILFKTDAANTKEQNALALLDAINKADIKGLKAELNATKTGVNLTRQDGGSIEINGRDDVLKALGLEKVSIHATSSENKGVFAKLTDTLNGMVGQEGTITKLSDSLTKDNERLSDERLDTQKKIDERYERMEMQFAQYDAIIGKLNRQFSALQSMIDAELAKK
ncbi:flagellar filament capping protein FliD [Campylobacter sputorum]|uniref:flagellar filament capping protein FliD n=1 Tax=Campylobacter sputorum TaxID=206 RepID=UPI00053BF72D|nr:flagellar filament capping protein FliD [Campylobacter sputorum]